MSKYREESFKYYKDVTKTEHHIVPVRFNLEDETYQDEMLDTNMNNDNIMTYDIENFIKNKNLNVLSYEVNGETHLPDMQYNLVLLFHHYSYKAVGFDPVSGTDYQETYHLDNSLVYTMDKLPETDEEYHVLAHKIIDLVGLKNLVDNESSILSNSEFCGETSFIIKAPKTDKVEVLTKESEPTELELAYYSNGKLLYNSKGPIGKWQFLGDSYHLDATEDKPFEIYNRLTFKTETRYDTYMMADSEGNYNILSKYNSNNGINYDKVISTLDKVINDTANKLYKDKMSTIDWS